MNEFEQAIGIWTYKFGGRDYTFEPNMLDFVNVRQIGLDYQKNDNKSKLIRQLCDYFNGLILTQRPELTDEEKVSLRRLIDFKATTLIDDIFISHGITSKEDMTKAKAEPGDATKNLEAGAS